MTETVAAFERHLLENLDDAAGWSAYADHLTEQGDPRGDFMRVQLALEDESLPKAERRALQEEEEALRVEHLDQWVGEDFATVYYDVRGRPKGGNSPFTFRRGWLWEAWGVEWQDHNANVGRPETFRWLHTLFVGWCEADLTSIPLTRNLRSLDVGDSEFNSNSGYLEDIPEFVAAANRLERLYVACGQANPPALFKLPLPLRELYVHCELHYDTAALADNPAFAGLHTIAFHPHCYDNSGFTAVEGALLCAGHVRAICHSPHLKRLEHLQLNCCNAGDEGIDLLVHSGLIRRLKSLDLRHGCVSDEGAFTLFKALDGTPHRLDTLKLDDNALTGDGLAALRRLKLTLDAGGQHAPGDDNYLTQGDFE